MKDVQKNSADLVINVGDFTTDFPFSSVVTKRIRELTPYSVKGNREANDLQPFINLLPREAALLGDNYFFGENAVPFQPKVYLVGQLKFGREFLSNYF